MSYEKLFPCCWSQHIYNTSWRYAGVLLCGRVDGQLEAWDLLERTHEPAMVLAVCPAALASLAFAMYDVPVEALGGASRRLLAAGLLPLSSFSGTVRVEAPAVCCMPGLMHKLQAL